MNEDGIPQAKDLLCEWGQPDDAEQSYSVEEGEQRKLASWTEMADTGALSTEALEELQQCPYLEIAISDFAEFEGLEDYKELMKTPKMKRAEKGIDQGLTSQKADLSKKKSRKSARAMRKRLRAPQPRLPLP